MAIFDPYIAKVTEYIEEMKAKGKRFREIFCPTSVDGLLQGLPVRIGPNASSGLVLRSDTFVELGNPEAGSCAFLLWTDNPGLVKDGKITILGPDIPESYGASLPFGQVLLIGGVELTQQDHTLLERTQYVSDQIEGYMLRSVPQVIWSRVSKEAVSRGFCFETLGRALMAIFKSSATKVQALEVLFVTSGRQDLHPLENIATQVRKIGRDIVREKWKAKGVDLIECTLGWDCRSCPDKFVCDDIKEIIAIRKKEKEEQTDDGAAG
jgi:CO dehydrogenase/acetyl-CoA synthase beta subunit